MIAPSVGFTLFIIVAYLTQGKYPGKARHDIRDYVPPEEDIISGEDLKHFKESEDPMPGEEVDNSNTLDPDDGDIKSKNRI